MAVELRLAPFTRAVLVGTIAAGTVLVVVFAALFVPFVNSWSDAAEVSTIIAIAMAVTFALVVVGAFFIGLPTTFVLHRLNRESEGSYIAAGTVFGFLLPFAILAGLGSATQGYWVCLLGAVGGAVAGLVWWRTYRRSQQSDELDR